jgi:hypothetical protein
MIMSNEPTVDRGRDSRPESRHPGHGTEMEHIGVAKEANTDSDLEVGSEGTIPVDLDKTGESALTFANPNMVDWDGPNDRANPQNWSKLIKIGHVTLISIITLLVYVVPCSVPWT